jgi:hypothetical protein
MSEILGPSPRPWLHFYENAVIAATVRRIASRVRIREKIATTPEEKPILGTPNRRKETNSDD